MAAEINDQVDAERGANEAIIKRWIEQSKRAEAKLDFNSNFKEFNGHVNATWDDTHLYKDAVSAATQFVPVNTMSLAFLRSFTDTMLGS